MKVDTLLSYTAVALSDADMSVKLNEMLSHIVADFNKDLSDVKYKYTDTDQLYEDAIKQKIIESGYSYISDVMNTITGLQFNRLLLFLDLISQLKGTRVGMDLVLKLLGFNSVIQEWWEQTPQRPPWSYQIEIFMDLSIVSNPYDTLDKIKTFSRYYQIANISNIDLLFTVSQFAQRTPIVGGFHKYKHFGEITQRVP